MNSHTKYRAQDHIKVQIMSDASWSQGSAGFGWSFQSELHRDRGKTVGTKRYMDSSHAELAGLCAAFRAAVSTHMRYAVPLKLEVTCDNLRALGLLLRVGAVLSSSSREIYPTMDPSSHELELLRWVTRNITTRNLVIVKWIKAHVEERTALTSVHAFTDRQAKQARWEGFLAREAGLMGALPS